MNARGNLPNIFCLETGGTLASTRTSDGIRPSISLKEIVARRIPEALEIANVAFPDEGTPGHFGKLIDSSNMQPEDWKRLATLIYNNLLEPYDGILVTMGTDTLAYAASALSIMLSPNKPVVITGSQRTFEEVTSDARGNFVAALIGASQLSPGIFVVFNGRVIDARFAKKVSAVDLDAFCGANRADVARVDVDSRVLHSVLPRLTTDLPLLKLDTLFDNCVKVETIIPGYEPEWLASVLQREDVKGLIIQAFGLGGLPNVGRRQLISILGKYARSKPIVVISQCFVGGTNLNDYEVGRKVLDTGVISAENQTLELASFRLKWLLAHFTTVEEIRVAFNEPC